MNAYRRPGYSTVPASDRHVLHVVSAHRQFAAQFLAAEEWHSIDAMRSELHRCHRDARAMSSGQAATSMRLRQNVGSALIRLGECLGGTRTAVTTSSVAG